MKQFLILSLSLVFLTPINSQDLMETQDSLPYHQIPEYPESYSSGNILARMVDGLGYRFYWATEGLKKEDLEYRPSEDASSVEETLDHLYALSTTIMNATTSTPNIRPLEMPDVGFDQKEL